MLPAMGDWKTGYAAEMGLNGKVAIRGLHEIVRRYSHRLAGHPLLIVGAPDVLDHSI